MDEENTTPKIFIHFSNILCGRGGWRSADQRNGRFAGWILNKNTKPRKLRVVKHARTRVWDRGLGYKRAMALTPRGYRVASYSDIEGLKEGGEAEGVLHQKGSFYIFYIYERCFYPPSLLISELHFSAPVFFFSIFIYFPYSSSPFFFTIHRWNDLEWDETERFRLEIGNFYSFFLYV